EAQLRNTICGVWIVATGIANLMAPGFIDITRDQMVDILTAVTQDFIVNGRFSDDPRISWFQDAKIAQGY
ncbi:TetR/AcrR family transcriptional regulator, partial [Lacticaseibacillus paracasei]